MLAYGHIDMLVEAVPIFETEFRTDPKLKLLEIESMKLIDIDVGTYFSKKFVKENPDTILEWEKRYEICKLD